MAKIGTDILDSLVKATEVTRELRKTKDLYLTITAGSFNGSIVLQPEDFFDTFGDEEFEYVDFVYNGKPSKYVTINYKGTAIESFLAVGNIRRAN